MFIFLIGVILVGKLVALPNKKVDCIKDPLMDATATANKYINNHIPVAKFFQISASLLMDLSLFGLFIYWIMFGKSGRVYYSLISFYLFRMVC